MGSFTLQKKAKAFAKELVIKFSGVVSITLDNSKLFIALRVFSRQTSPRILPQWFRGIVWKYLVCNVGVFSNLFVNFDCHFMEAIYVSKVFYKPSMKSKKFVTSFKTKTYLYNYCCHILLRLLGLCCMQTILAILHNIQIFFSLHFYYEPTTINIVTNTYYRALLLYCCFYCSFSCYCFVNISGVFSV